MVQQTTYSLAISIIELTCRKRRTELTKGRCKRLASLAPLAMRATILILALIFSACIAVPLTIGFALPPVNDEYYTISQRVLNGIRFWANETADWQLGSSTSTKGTKYTDFPIVVEETGATESIGDAYVRLASKVDALVENIFFSRE